MECVDDVESMLFTSRRDDVLPVVLGTQVNVDSIPGLSSDKFFEKDFICFFLMMRKALNLYHSV
jgi:hypothetical protein